MKKIIKIFIATLVLFVSIIVPIDDVYAVGSFTVSSSASTVSPNANVTITIRATKCAGQFSISATNGAKVSTSSVWIDSGYGSSASSTVTVTAPSSGSFTVSVTASSVASDDATTLTGTKSVTVSVSSGSSSGGSSSSGSTTTTPADTRDKDSSLKSLTVSDGTISPEFNKDTKFYKVTVMDLNTITIGADSMSSKASITGTGSKELKLGDNEFEVKVTAENETSTTYTILVTLDKTPEVFDSYGDLNLGVVQNQNDITIPDNFEDTTVIINDSTVQAYFNPVLDMTIVYMINDEGEKDFYIYDEGITSKYVQLAFLGRSFVFIDIPVEEQEVEGYIYGDIVIGENILKGWSFEEETMSSYSVFKAYDEFGEYITYLYDETSNSMIIKPEVNFVPLTQEASSYSDSFTETLIYVVAATSAISIISLIFAFRDTVFSVFKLKR